MYFEQFIRYGSNAQKLDRDKILFEILLDEFNQDFIIALQKEQLRFGIRGDDSEMPDSNPDYVDAVRRIRGSQIKPTGRVNLQNTGEYYDTIDVELTPTSFIMIANNSIYGKDFRDLYGFNILGLTDASIQKLIEFIRPTYEAKIIELILS